MRAWQIEMLKKHPEMRRQFEWEARLDSFFAHPACFRGLDEHHTGCILEYGHTGSHVAVKKTMLCRCQGGWYPCITPHNDQYCPSAEQDPGDEDGEQKFRFDFTRFNTEKET